MTSWNVNDNLPTLQTGKKIAIVYTADKESNLLAKLAIQKYGSDDVYLLSQSIRCKQEYESSVISKIQSGVQLVGATHHIHITRDDINELDGSYARLFPTFYRKTAEYLDAPISALADLFPYIMIDRTRTEIDLLKFDLSETTTLDAFKAQIVQSDKGYILNDISDLRLQWYLDNPFETPDVTIMLSDSVLRPFGELTNTDVMNLYDQLGELELLWNTSSCNNPEVDGHCGACMSCQDRRIQIAASNVNDLTVYTI